MPQRMPRLLCYALLLFASSLHFPTTDKRQPAYSGFVAHEWARSPPSPAPMDKESSGRPLTVRPICLPLSSTSQCRLQIRPARHVRMGNPVLYFYSPRAKPFPVNVRFAQAVTTECTRAPAASSPPPPLYDAISTRRTLMEASRGTLYLRRAKRRSSQRPAREHYYAARQTTRRRSVKTQRAISTKNFSSIAACPPSASPSRQAEAENKLRRAKSQRLPIPNTILLRAPREKAGFRVNGVLQIEPPSIRPT